jgi:hypothetical protein
MRSAKMKAFTRWIRRRTRYSWLFWLIVLKILALLLVNISRS